MKEPQPTRRTFLSGAGLAGAGLVGAGALGTSLAVATTRGAANSQPAGAAGDDPRFTIAVVPDTQFLFDGDRGDPEPLAASLAYLIEHRAEHNIVFVAHLGDVVENAEAAELRQAGRVLGALDEARLPYSVVAGNHDIDAATDDQRGPSAYLDVFGPRRFAAMPTFGGATADGYNTYHLFRAAGRDWLLLALDWRPSARSLAWARGVLARHPRTPAILTTHELVAADPDGAVDLPAHGRRLWAELIRDHDQIFLTLNGHFWPPGRTVRRNAAGHDVHLHITNYQNRYYGGCGMIRLYQFDTARDVIDVRTLAPWVLAQAPHRRNPLAARETELTDPANLFSVPIDFRARFAGFDPVPAPPPRSARAVTVRGTVAYWRFAGLGTDGAAPADAIVEDRSGCGNHLTRVTLDGAAGALACSRDHHRNAPARGSLRFTGGQRPARGAYLRTADDAPLNGLTFSRGYTIEAYVKLPPDARRGHARMGVLRRLGTAADAGRVGGDPAGPLAALSISDGLAAQWSAVPLRRGAARTNWGHELPVDDWFHLAVVNDGRLTTMYVDGAAVLRNPARPAGGLATVGLPWL
ncbi:MAG TPA: metallophosphoesterase, partial [Pilimelia sp.]|nr:metallophosphoesterase [Pilimelia sp.]